MEEKVGVKKETKTAKIAEEVSITISDSIPNREGYIFIGWSKDSNSEIAEYNINETYNFNESTTLYAVWRVGGIALQINPNGGVYEGSKEITIVAGNTGETVTINSPIPPTASTVTFNGNGGDTPESLKNSITFNKWLIEGDGTLEGDTFEFGEKGTVLTAQYTTGNITLPNTSKLGETFKGWYDQQTGGTRVGGAGDKYTPASDVTLYAQWEVNSYKLTINPNGGTWNGDTGNSEIIKEFKTSVDIANPIPPSDDTVTFNGNGGSTPNSIKSSNIFDKWNIEGEGELSGSTYTFGPGDGTLIAEYRNEEINLPEATKTGYQLEGWYNSNNEFVGKQGESYEPNGTETLVAHWKANNYTIHFDGNGATGGSMTNLDMTYDSAKDLTENTFVRDGYEFIGWSTDKNAKEPQFTNNGNVNNLTSDNNGTVTLYAMWNKNIGINYDEN